MEEDQSLVKTSRLGLSEPVTKGRSNGIKISKKERSKFCALGSRMSIILCNCIYSKELFEILTYETDLQPFLVFASRAVSCKYLPDVTSPYCLVCSLLGGWRPFPSPCQSCRPCSQLFVQQSFHIPVPSSQFPVTVWYLPVRFSAPASPAVTALSLHQRCTLCVHRSY